MGTPRRLLITLLLACVGGACRLGGDPELLVVHEPPRHFDRRSHDLHANVVGELALGADATYRLNESPEVPVPQGEPRSPAPRFLIEMEASNLRFGLNRLEIHAQRDDERQTATFVFLYDPAPPRWPLELDWENAPITVGDGRWERLRGDDGQWRVRSVPGDEGWDRILMLAGGSTEGRRVEAEMIYRYRVESGDMGFGILPLWGGHPDEPGVRPRRGWLYGIAWYSERHRGVGAEFSNRRGKEPISFTNRYVDYRIEPDARYRVIAEAWPEHRGGRFVGYRQRMKWWRAGEAEPEKWIELADDQRQPLPERDYAVAFVCYRSQVELGPVRITQIPPRETSVP